ncbi:MAG: hypothetical protein M1360_04370 [Candidatus Marsarchaeota archaeon]|nr:hypothetical protein [Candidatus Marsarchaeota archaeon]
MAAWKAVDLQDRVRFPAKAFFSLAKPIAALKALRTYDTSMGKQGKDAQRTFINFGS